MKFNAWSRKRLELGTKRLTSRRTDQEADRDVEYVVGPLPWGFIRDFLWRDEGAESPEELQRVINQIHRQIVPDDKMLFVHVLKDDFLVSIRNSRIMRENIERFGEAFPD